MPGWWQFLDRLAQILGRDGFFPPTRAGWCEIAVPPGQNFYYVVPLLPVEEEK